MRKIVHLSDMHFGKIDEQSIQPLLDAIEKINPDLVINSGDLTQRARVKEFKEAYEFLEKIKQPKFVIPGNHDIRALFHPILRIINPYDRYKKHISSDLDPMYHDDELAVASIRTVRSHALKDGRVNKAQITKAHAWLASLPDHLTKIIVTHHPFNLPFNWPDHKLAKRAKMAVHKLAEAGVDLYLSGHYHLSLISATTSRYKIDNYSAIAVQAGTISTRIRGESPSFNVITINKKLITVETYFWDQKKQSFVRFSIKKCKKHPDGWAW